MVCDVQAPSVDVRCNAHADICAAAVATAASAAAASLNKSVQCTQLAVNMMNVTWRVTRKGQSNLQRVNLHEIMMRHFAIENRASGSLSQDGTASSGLKVVEARVTHYPSPPCS
jgi:hypothetical protein